MPESKITLGPPRKITQLNRADGGVSFLELREGQDFDRELALSLAQFPAEWLPVTVGRGISWNEYDQMQQDRDFRNAWRTDGEKVAVDMTAARELLRDKIRIERQGKFAKLDADWMKATAKNDTAAQAEAEAKRQELRDLPAAPEIDAATTPEELKAAWPSRELGNRRLAKGNNAATKTVNQSN